MSCLFVRIIVVTLGDHVADPFVCPNIETVIATASAGRFNALPILEVIGQLPNQIFEPVGIEILEMNWAKSLGYSWLCHANRRLRVKGFGAERPGSPGAGDPRDF
ncbi:MAG: hypothetical protein ABIN18_29745 [Pseudomonadota bacterium]